MRKKTGATAERLALAARASELREQGLMIREIAELLGISRSYAGGLLTDPDGSRDRARKASYSGVCADCGFPTSGSDGAALAPGRCIWCTSGRTRPVAARPRLAVPLRLEDVPLEVRLEAVRFAARRETERAVRDELLLAAIYPSDQTYWVSESAAEMLEQWKAA